MSAQQGLCGAVLRAACCPAHADGLAIVLRPSGTGLTPVQPSFEVPQAAAQCTGESCEAAGPVLEMAHDQASKPKQDESGGTALSPSVPQIDQVDGTDRAGGKTQQPLPAQNRFAMPCSDVPYEGTDSATLHDGSAIDSMLHPTANDATSQLQAQLAQEGMHILQALDIISEEKASAAESTSRRSSVAADSDSRLSAFDAPPQPVRGMYTQQCRQHETEVNELILAVVKQHVHELSEEDVATALPTPLSVPRLAP